MEFSKRSPSYYSILGVSAESSDEEIRRAYRKLAMRWHPDKWSKNPSLLGEAKQKFQEIQEAYSVLSDRRKRTLYDTGLYDFDEEEDEVEGFTDFLQEMAILMNDVRKEERSYSNEELQSMFWEMARDFTITTEWDSSLEHSQYDWQWFCGSSNISEEGNMTRHQWEPKIFLGNPHLSNSEFKTYDAQHFCR